MTRILLDDIKSITKGTTWDFAITNKSLESIISDIVNSLFSPYGESLALEAQRLWIKSQDRETVQSLLMIAHDIDQDWRRRNQERSTELILASTSPYEIVLFASLTRLNVSQELALRAKFKTMNPVEFKTTVYYRSIEKEVLDRYQQTCHKCMSTAHIQVMYKRYPQRGMEHRHLDYLEALCNRCIYVAEPPGGDEWHEVGRTVPVKQL